MEDTVGEWPLDKLNALRLGRRLVAEVAVGRPGRRAFVDIVPVRVPEDITAEREGWVHADRARSFVIRKWEYAEEYQDGNDYDIGAEHVVSREAHDEEHLSALVADLGLKPTSFKHPWDTDDPR